MSDGSLNYPVRTTHPEAPTAGRMKTYSLIAEPYFMLEDGVPRLFKGVDGSQGPQGDQGIQGDQGVQGNVGPAGPAGPVSLAFKLTETALVTLPDSTTKTFVTGLTFNVPSIGDYVMTAKIGFRPSSASVDMEFDWRLDNNVLDDDSAEEHKDSSAAQKHGRPFQQDLGSLASGNHDLDLYFSKESTGGTAQLKYLSLFIWRVS